MKKVSLAELVAFCDEMDRVKGVATVTDIANKFGIPREDALVYMRRMTKKMGWEVEPMIGKPK